MDSSKQLNRKELMKEYEDLQFRILVHDFSVFEAEILLEESNKNHEVPSPEASEKFHRVMDKAFRRKHRQSIIRILPKALNRVAVTLFALTLTFSVLVASVQAFRVDFLNFLITFQKEYTSIRLDSENMVVGDNLIVPWTNSYAPTYVPSGYKIARISFAESVKSISFMNEQGNQISYYEYASASAANLDTENADSVEEIQINGQNGLLIEKDGYSTVAWALDNRMFVVYSQIYRDGIVKIAESVRFIE